MAHLTGKALKGVHFVLLIANPFLNLSPSGRLWHKWFCFIGTSAGPVPFAPPFCQLDLLNAIIVLPEYSFFDLIIVYDIGSF